MDSRPADPWNDDWIDHLAAFDEALRLGRAPGSDSPSDPALVQTQQFLLRLHSAWPRAPKKIGPYTLVRSLGQGAIGPSYLVEGTNPARPGVLKILWPDLCADAATRQQFVQDARVAQQLRHPAVVPVREVRDQGSLCIVVSDYCAGVSLALWRKKKPQPIAWDIAGSLIVKLADILAAAHQQGIIHANLKPANIFLTDAAEITLSTLHQAEVQVSDFALAKAVQQTRLPSQGGLAWPMPQYLAPEQLQHRSLPAEPASDLFALGVLWYDLLTGRCPIKGGTREECLANVKQPVPPPRQYRPEVPIAVEHLVMQCLRRRISDRPASAQHLADALRALLPVAAPQPAPPWWKRWLAWN